MTRDRLVAIRRFLTFEEPCDPPMAREEIDVILRLAENELERLEQHECPYLDCTSPHTNLWWDFLRETGLGAIRRWEK